MSTDSNHAQRAGRAVGSFAKTVKDAADQGRWIEKSGKVVGRTYQNSTGRDARADGNVAGAVAVAGGTMLLAGVALKAASAVVTTALVAGAGAAGAVVYCRAKGKPEELSSLHDTAVNGISTVARGTNDFVSGVRQGVQQGGAQSKQS
eukprot:jgi/Ulvmu1/7768/UM039_0077.1